MLLSQILVECEKLWPGFRAESWDSPGLAVGNENSQISQILFAVDVTLEVIDEAKRLGAELIFSHHPAIFRGVSSLAESQAKGKLLSDAIRSDIALFSAHTNADVVNEGVSDVIARRLGLTGIEPLVATEAGIGHGRVGHLQSAITVLDLLESLERVLPSTARGIATTAALDTRIQKIALCGGAGDSFIEHAYASGADVFITSDLRHHVAQEAPLPLIDVSHWASESLWLETAAAQLGAVCAGVEIVISDIVTDPWVFSTGRNVQ